MTERRFIFCTSHFTSFWLIAGCFGAMLAPAFAQSACDINGDGHVDVGDAVSLVNQVLGNSPCTADLNRNGVCDRGDVQRVANAALGFPCVIGPSNLAAPSGLTANIVGGAVNLTWTAAPGANITGYLVFRNSRELATASSTTYSDAAVTAGATYTYAVAAFDNNTEVSLLSAPAVVTVPQVPAVSSFSAAPTSIVAGQSATLSWSVSGTPAPSLSINNGVGSVSGRSSVSVSPPVTTTYTLTATNSVGNASANTTVTVTPDVSPPSVPSGLTALAPSSLL